MAEALPLRCHNMDGPGPVAAECGLAIRSCLLFLRSEKCPAELARESVRGLGAQQRVSERWLRGRDPQAGGRAVPMERTEVVCDLSLELSPVRRGILRTV